MRMTLRQILAWHTLFERRRARARLLAFGDAALAAQGEGKEINGHIADLARLADGDTEESVEALATKRRPGSFRELAERAAARESSGDACPPQNNGDAAC